MATKSERVEARLSPEQRERIEQAAQYEGRSVSSFMVDAAMERAEHLLAQRDVTTVPAEYFDHLLLALDDPDRVPNLKRVAKRAARRRRIA